MEAKMISILKRSKKIYKKYQRKTRIYMLKKRCGSYVDRVQVGGFTQVTKNTFLGDNVNFNGLVISGSGRVDIGNNFHSGPDCLFICQNHNFDKGESIPYDSTYILKDIVIEDNVWLGSRVIVLGGVTIGEGAIIQAGSTVVSDIPKYAIAGGHPAKVFSQRNVEHYETLKTAKKFL